MKEDIEEFFGAQFSVWPEVKERYLQLGETKRRKVEVNGYPIFLQCNPARIISTAAKTDAKSISERPCVLCAANRPPQQIAGFAIPGWEILVNPFPIFPVHFNVVNSQHRPQDKVPLEAMVHMVEIEPLLTAFYNGAKGGASLPDHLHFQAVLKEELPLLEYTENNHPSTGESSMMESDDFLGPVHFPYKSYSLFPDEKGKEMIEEIERIADDYSNVFVWTGRDGDIRVIVFRRKKHRPSCYGEGEGKYLVSPGAIDMAGVMIFPKEEDFEKITAEEIEGILDEV